MSMISKSKVLITHPEVPAEALQLLSRTCDLIMVNSLPPKRSEILEKSKGVDALFWGSHEPLNAEVLDNVGQQLKAVSVMSAGFDYVDVNEFRKRKIPLGHTPNVLSDAVADMAIGLMIAAARRFHEGRTKIETCNWVNYHLDWMLGADIKGATVGIFGFGSVGQTIVKRLKGFDIDRVLYNTRHRASIEIEAKYNASHVSFEELLNKSDFIFIAAPLTQETAGKFDAAAFSQMKKSSVFINVGRGGIVNQKDLYDALKNNKIFSAGLDVMDPEPLPADDPLLSLPNIVLVPHLGSATKRTRTDMAILAANNVLKGIDSKPMDAPVYEL